MKIVHLCKRNVSRLYYAGWFDTYRYRYKLIGITPNCCIIAERYRLIDIARRDYGNFEYVKIRW